jgi:hypothetical protein
VNVLDFLDNDFEGVTILFPCLTKFLISSSGNEYPPLAEALDAIKVEGSLHWLYHGVRRRYFGFDFGFRSVANGRCHLNVAGILLIWGRRSVVGNCMDHSFLHIRTADDLKIRLASKGYNDLAKSTYVKR